MPTTAYHLAIDIGASSGRHIIGWVENGKINLQEVYRFDNNLIEKNGHLCWDIAALQQHVLQGLQHCKTAGMQPATVGIDTWAVDFVLLDKNNTLLGDAVAYRDERSRVGQQIVEAVISPQELYAISGIQKLSFNTVYQLAALQQEHPAQLQQAAHFLMIPDYLNFCLCGQIANEYTNATSTALVNAKTKNWDYPLLNKLGLPTKIFKQPTMAGHPLGSFTAEVQQIVGYNAVVVLPATHDTGSAFLAVPAKNENAAYLSSGTWSLLGVEQTSPLLSSAAYEANFSNEGGYQGRFRVLKNIMGLWMIQSIRRNLNKQYSFAQLEQMAKQAAAFTTQINVNDAAFLAPDNMLQAVKSYCIAHGMQPPATIGETMQCVYTSLAACYANFVQELCTVTGRRYTAIHIVGGGSKDAYLNQLTANATGLPVYAGPTEGTALGNLIVQFIMAGYFDDLAQARQAIRNSMPIQQYLPQEG